MSIPVKALKPLSQVRLDKVQAKKRTAKSTGCCAPGHLAA
jgi:hypothetical protein